MKRLLWYLNQIADGGTATFRYTVNADGGPVQKEIYDGECEVTYLKPSGELSREENRDRNSGIRRVPTYWQNGVARALKQYIKDGTKIRKQKCPNCGEESLVFQEKCPHCTSCGWSKCG